MIFDKPEWAKRKISKKGVIIQKGYESDLNGYLEDAELRAAAKPLRPMDYEVTTDEKNHPFIGAVCDHCGAHARLLTHCGRVLCIPCWRKQSRRSMGEILPVVVRANRAYWRSIRFITLTLRSNEKISLNDAVKRLTTCFDKLKKTEWWRIRVSGTIAKIEVTLSEVNGWHAHFHLITVGGEYIPAWPQNENIERFNDEDRAIVAKAWERSISKYRKTTDAGDSEKGREGNLCELWHAITGDSWDIWVESAHKTLAELAFELSKYAAKPLASDSEGNTSIDKWPLNRRMELAELLAGGYRVKWYCHVHKSHKREDCIDYLENPTYGTHALPCEGRYRKERSGFRRLRWSGLFLKLRKELTQEEKDIIRNLCPNCQIGQLKTEKFWSERFDYGDDRADYALDLIKAHKFFSEAIGELEKNQAIAEIASAEKAIAEKWIIPDAGDTSLSDAEMFRFAQKELEDSCSARICAFLNDGDSSQGAIYSTLDHFGQPVVEKCLKNLLIRGKITIKGNIVARRISAKTESALVEGV